MQFSWHLLFYNTEYRRPHALSISEFFSSISAVLTFHKSHVKEPSTITQSQIQKHALSLFLITKLNKLPPFIHLKLVNSHTNCFTKPWSGGIPLPQDHCCLCKEVLQLQQEQGIESPPKQLFNTWSTLFQTVVTTQCIPVRSHHLTRRQCWCCGSFQQWPSLISAKTQSAMSNSFCCIF